MGFGFGGVRPVCRAARACPLQQAQNVLENTLGLTHDVVAVAFTLTFRIALRNPELAAIYPQSLAISDL